MLCYTHTHTHTHTHTSVPSPQTTNITKASALYLLHTYACLVAVATHRVKEGLQDNISDNGEPMAAVGHSVRLAIVKSVALTDGENLEKKDFAYM